MGLVFVVLAEAEKLKTVETGCFRPFAKKSGVFFKTQGLEKESDFVSGVFFTTQG
jgi:hypothetical protein